MKIDYIKVNTKALLIEQTFTNAEKLQLCSLLLSGMTKEECMDYKKEMCKKCVLNID